MRLTDWRIPRILLPVAAGVLLVLLLAACGGGGGEGPNGSDDSQQSQFFEVDEQGAIKYLQDPGPRPSFTYTLLKLLSPHTRSVIKVDTGNYKRLCCGAAVGGKGSADLAREQVLGLEWTGTLSTIFEDPGVPGYEYGNITVIDGVDNMLFLQVDITTREPWKNVLRNQGYERSEVKDVVLWIGPPPWEAFAFVAHDLIVSNSESNMTELLERRFTGGASFYDLAGDLWESLPSGGVQSLEQTSDGIIRGVSVSGFSRQGSKVDVEVARLVDYMDDEQAELDIQEWMWEWEDAFSGSCSEPVTNLEGLRYSFETVCPADLVLDDSRSS